MDCISMQPSAGYRLNTKKNLDYLPIGDWLTLKGLLTLIDLQT